jgi:hypothetical protein
VDASCGITKINERNRTQPNRPDRVTEPPGEDLGRIRHRPIVWLSRAIGFADAVIVVSFGHL